MLQRNLIMIIWTSDITHNLKHKLPEVRPSAQFLLFISKITSFSCGVNEMIYLKRGNFVVKRGSIYDGPFWVVFVSLTFFEDFQKFGSPVRGDMRYAQTATVLSFIWRTLSHCLYFSDHKGCSNCKKMIILGKGQMTFLRDINYSNSTLTGVKLTDNL